MKVFYDGQAFDMQMHGGVSRYVSEIYRNLPAGVEAVLGIMESDNVYLRQMGFPQGGDTYRQFIAARNFPMKRFLYRAYYNISYGHPERWDHTPKLNQLYSERLLKRRDFDVFHATYFDGYFLPVWGDKPFVLTVHDMISELFPQYYERDHVLVRGKQLLIPKATHLIAVSQQTKEDLIRTMNIPEDRITVIYHGVDATPYTPSVLRPFNEEYILYVGERHLYKNFKAFCRAVAPVLQRHKQLMVVCTGKPFSKDEQLLMEHYGVANRMRQVFVETDQDFMDLYHYAVTFVYPSAYEGFGMPILEAYKADCPVMLNHASCFPEIAGDAAVYFHISNEASDFEEQFETLYHLNSRERQSLLEKQRERLKLYSWKKSAQEHAAVYQKLLGQF